ncbi:hypothetical protein AB0G04_38255 [Actinoplanes sp. NPDC023801]|uniref:hypothetical protein n=1 Tax=Actinoplanes sp. NPDC023801 TaxID=3154595 RepID=UPI00340E9C05
MRVPPKLMAHARDGARTYGRSDPIDALAALRDPDLPTAHLDGSERDLRLLTERRDDLVAERTRAVDPLRWHLHDLDPQWAPAAVADQHPRLHHHRRPADRTHRHRRPHRPGHHRTVPAAHHRDQHPGNEITALARKLAPALLEILVARH